ncbi:MAG: DUF1289 domain-containing protein [Methylophilaceae bacterium]|nr:DUF1289 domain-containing protein [Methylophilaceae bacterium]
MSIENIVSPCIGVCSMNDFSLCAGCYRTIDEIREWWNMNDGQRSEVMSVLGAREESSFE